MSVLSYSGSYLWLQDIWLGYLCIVLDIVVNIIIKSNKKVQ